MPLENAPLQHGVQGVGADQHPLQDDALAHQPLADAFEHARFRIARERALGDPAAQVRKGGVIGGGIHGAQIAYHYRRSQSRRVSRYPAKSPSGRPLTPASRAKMPPAFF